MSQQFPPPAPQQFASPTPQPAFQPQVIIQQPANLSPTVTIGEWFIFTILMSIPLLNFIMLIVYACDSSKPSRANLAKLQLILMIVFSIIGIVTLICIGGIAGLAAIANK
ncbi:MAG: hypothetical protein IJS15_03750 [Victivallales bacterium]|nr:hypothetical protein [Victivallales bacterium]